MQFADHGYRILAKLVVFLSSLFGKSALLERVLAAARGNKKLYDWLGKAFLARGDAPTATHVFRTAALNLPGDLEVGWRYALALFRQSEYEEALLQFQRNLSHWPESQDEPYRSWHAQTHALIASCLWHLRNVPEAREHLSVAQKSAPWDLDACRAAIDLYPVDDGFDKILGFLDDYIEAYPELYPPYIWRADHLQYRLYAPQESLSWYAAAGAKMNNKEIAAYCERYESSGQMLDLYVANYAEALRKCGMKEAESQLLASYARNPSADPITAKETLFESLLAEGDIMAAENLALEALKHRGDIAEHWVLLVRVQIKQGRYEEAQQNISRATSLDSHLLVTYPALAELQRAQHLWSAAAQTYEKLLQVLPFEPEWIEDQAQCYLQMGDVEAALRLYQDVTRLDPHDAVAWVDLAQVYLALGQGDRSRGAIQRALQFGHLVGAKRDEAVGLLHQFG